ncbi:hypothetical protein C8F04DRAFT_1181420 [Mycena alexandri]|uniref:Uncharacterized protein n=1 Tax=Mycena alexandri TaxID=1745969 RepID=A0AAD6X5M4_9AGAR|nr:hypothetical protein C8F04DRAFT_1181420 [Mycena alexandri]
MRVSDHHRRGLSSTRLRFVPLVPLVPFVPFVPFVARLVGVRGSHVGRLVRRRGRRVLRRWSRRVVRRQGRCIVRRRVGVSSRGGGGVSSRGGGRVSSGGGGRRVVTRRGRCVVARRGTRVIRQRGSVSSRGRGGVSSHGGGGVSSRGGGGVSSRGGGGASSGGGGRVSSGGGGGGGGDAASGGRGGASSRRGGGVPSGSSSSWSSGGGGGVPSDPGQSKERFDPRAANVGKDYFIPREKVDLWSKDKLDEWRKVWEARKKKSREEEKRKATQSEPNGADKNGPETSVPSESTPAAQPTPEAPAGTAAGCEERWKNLGEDSLKRMWGIYDETGIFICLCRHGFVLLVEDMVRSGELSKYALAACAELLEDFDGAVGSGYDVGCGFAGTLFNSPLGAKALLKKFMFLVGAFHGHAHNQLCQLIYLATYVLGLGLEDLEGCERFFSKSNAMAASIRYASVFHRRQILASYFKHFDTNETYANLSKLLVDNYWQALEILEGEPALYLGMKAAGIDDVAEFPRRLEAEFTFLKSLMADSEEDTLHMEYYQRLVNLADRRLKLELTKCKDSTASATVRRHAQENFDKAWIEVQETKVRMGVKERWLDTSPEWAEAAHLVSTKRYRLALLKLERLVVQRMFELTKMNLSQTGYKLRKHIAKALQVRSQAIRNALNSYNTAAKSIVPAGRQLSWSEVIEYAFLADFDLLRKPAELGEVHPWSTPAACLLLDNIRDEKAFLTAKENELQESDPGLAWCILHMERFQKLAKQAGSGFTGTLEPGVLLRQVIPEPSGMEGVVETGRQEEEIQAQALAREMEAVGASEDEEDDDDDVGGEEEDSKLAEELHTIFIVSEDDPVPLSP